METIILLITCMAFAFWCGQAFAHDRFAELRILICEQSEEIKKLLARLDGRQINIECTVGNMYYEIMTPKEFILKKIETEAEAKEEA